jgi:hypothetical protein
MVTNLKSIPYYVLLLPASVVLHGFIQHFGYISSSDAFLLALTYSFFYDSISNVNQFRMLFNSMFNLKLPLLKASTLYLTDKGGNTSQIGLPH